MVNSNISKAPLFFLSNLLLFSSCLTPLVVEIEEVKLNDNTQEHFQPGETPDRNLYQYGQNNDKALDILVPIDPTGNKEIRKSTFYWVTAGSKVEFNMETIMQYRSYKPAKNFKKKGELETPLQWLSACTLRDPVSGNKQTDVNGEEFETAFNAGKASNMFEVYLQQCTEKHGSWPNNIAPYGPFWDGCTRYLLGQTSDPIDFQRAETAMAYPACLLGGRMPINEPCTFYWELYVLSYNDTELKMEKKYFHNTLEPSFLTISHDEVFPYRVQMTADPNNTNANLLKYTFQMPEYFGKWQDNFAGDISIDYVRFYWTDRRGNLLPIKMPNQLGRPEHVLQVNTGNVCRESDERGIFWANQCPNFGAYNPASTKINPITLNAWKMQVTYDDYYLELVDNMSRPVIMEFGLKAD